MALCFFFQWELFIEFIPCYRIDFNNPGTDKPANLANSAVLRMLEEEERNRRGLPSKYSNKF